MLFGCADPFGKPFQRVLYILAGRGEGDDFGFGRIKQGRLSGIGEKRRPGAFAPTRMTWVTSLGRLQGDSLWDKASARLPHGRRRAVSGAFATSALSRAPVLATILPA